MFPTLFLAGGNWTSTSEKETRERSRLLEASAFFSFSFLVLFVWLQLWLFADLGANPLEKTPKFKRPVFRKSRFSRKMVARRPDSVELAGECKSTKRRGKSVREEEKNSLLSISPRRKKDQEEEGAEQLGRNVVIISIATSTHPEGPLLGSRSFSSTSASVILANSPQLASCSFRQ